MPVTRKFVFELVCDNTDCECEVRLFIEHKKFCRSHLPEGRSYWKQKNPAYLSFTERYFLCPICTREVKDIDIDGWNNWYVETL